MLLKKYNNLYSRQIFKINSIQNIITRLFLSRFSPIKKKFKNTRLVDFSCGSGPYLVFFKKLGFKVYATEISDSIISKLKKKFSKIKFKTSNNNEIDFPNNFFKFFIAIHSIYYMKDKFSSFDDTIKLVRSKIQRGGYFIFTIPTINQEFLKFKKINNNVYEIIYDKYKLRKNSYFYLFNNQKEIKNYFNKFFKVIRVGKVNVDFLNLKESYFLCVLKKK